MPQQVTPYVLYEDTNAAIDWLTSAFGFTEVLRYEDDGVVTHAELELAARGEAARGLGGD